MTSPSTSIRVWRDDMRDAPDGWMHAHTAHEAIALTRIGSRHRNLTRS